MNKTKIEWCDFTWNPVTGCYHNCEYCYARKVANRFYPKSVGFKPYFWRERLLQPQKVEKASRIFVSSMGDLFGKWVPWEWIKAILAAVEINPQHTFQFLTKNPARYQEFNPWPANCWLGTTVTNQSEGERRVPEMFKAQARVRFISYEPLLEKIDAGFSSAYIDWAIVGAMTGPGAIKPHPEWVKGLIDQYLRDETPLFLKNNLGWPVKIQEFPTTS